MSTGLVAFELHVVLFPFVFQTRLHNRQSVTVLTSRKVSSTGIPTRNHTNGTSWKQDSSKIRLKEGLKCDKCDLALETWKQIKEWTCILDNPAMHKIPHVRNPKKSTLYTVQELTIINSPWRKEELKLTPAFWQFTNSRQYFNSLSRTHYETIEMLGKLNCQT